MKHSHCRSGRPDTATPTPRKRKHEPSAVHSRSLPSSQKKRLPSTPSSSVKVSRSVPFEDLLYADDYKTFTRARLMETSEELRGQKRRIDQCYTDSCDILAELTKQCSSEEAEIQFVTAYLVNLEDKNNTTKNRIAENEQERAQIQADLGDISEKLTSVEYMLSFDTSKPYAKNPMSFVQSDLGLFGPSDTARLGYNASLEVLCQQKNLGLELNEAFTEETILTGKGSDDTAELHRRINSYMGFDGATETEESAGEVVENDFESALREFKAN